MHSINIQKHGKMKIKIGKQMGAAVGLALFVVSAFAEDVFLDVETNLVYNTAISGGFNAVNATCSDSVLGTLRIHANLNIKAGTAATLNADTGKALTVYRLTGGRGFDSTLTKTGAGTLSLKDARKYGGTLILKGGTLDLSKRTVPTSVSQLAADPYFHLDASDLSSLKTEVDADDGKTYVKFWSSDGVGVCKGERVAGAQVAYSWKNPKYMRPWLIRDALGAGKHAVDFGFSNSFNNNYDTAATYADEKPTWRAGALMFATNYNYEAKTVVAPTGLKTVIALMGAQHNGGYLLATAGRNHDSRPFSRGTSWAGGGISWKNAIAKEFTYSSVTYEPSAFLDGRPALKTSGFESPAYHAFAIRQDSAGLGVDYIGAGTHGNTMIYPGALILCEMFVYDRFLSDEEILDIQAYLTKKWMGDLTPGYREPAAQAEIASVTVVEPSTIHVPAGETARIGKLTLDAPLVKDGEGTLEAFEIAGSAAVTFAGGTIRYADRPDAGDALAAIAPGASMFLDMTATNSMLFRCAEATGALNPVNGTNVVSTFASVSGMNSAYAGSVPYFIPDALNGLPALYYGPKFNYGPYLKFARPMDGVHSVYFLWGTHGGGGYTIGSANNTDADADNKNNNIFDFMRDNTPTYSGSNRLITGNGGGDVMQTDDAALIQIGTNGVMYSSRIAPAGDDWYLVEIHTKTPAHASAIKVALDRTSYSGVGYIGDLLIYERELTDREKVQTRNALMKKWFAKADAELTPLPAKPASHEGQFVPRVLEVDGAATVDAAKPIVNLYLKGEGTLVKTGASDLQISHLLDFNGTVEVASGKLILKGQSTGFEAKMPTEGQILRFDMSNPSSLTTSTVASGTKLVSAVNLAAEKTNVETINAVNTPLVIAEEPLLNNLPVVKMDSNACFQFKDAGNKVALLDGIQTILWVIGSQEGGGWLMGGGTNKWSSSAETWHYPWHHGTKVVDGVTYDGREVGGHIAPLVNSNAQKEALKSAYRRNFTPISYTAGLTGGYDLLSMVGPELDPESEDCRYTMSAEGFAFDGRGLNYGCQRLGEVLVYNRRLDEQELKEAETYLAYKWNMMDTIPPGRTASGLAVAAGAEVDFNGTTQYVASVSGAGEFLNGVLETAKIVWDFENPTMLTAAAFAFAEGFAVEVLNAPAKPELADVKILDCSEFSGRENFVKTAVTGVTGSLRLKADGLYLRLGMPGMLILFK